MKVVAISSSPRRDGNTAILLRHVLAELDVAGIETELVQLAGKSLSGCTGCLKCATALDNHCHGVKDDGVNECIDKMLAADGILLGTPVYFGDANATMRALIERTGYATRKNGNPLARKVGAAVIAVRRGGAMHAFDSVNHFFQIAAMVVVGSSYWNFGIGGEAGAVESDAEGLQTMHNLGINMAWVLGKLNA
jgi:multimeric flavodoxin WrbA